MNENDSSEAKRLIESALKDVVTENGRPVFLSRYGWKVEELDGKKYVMAMSKEESESFDLKIEEGRGRPLSGECVIDDFNRCYQSSCTGRCDLAVISGQWKCICSG